MIEIGGVRIHHRGEKIGEHADRRAATLHPSPETRTDVARGVRTYQLEELLVGCLRALRDPRCGSLELLAHLGGRRLPGRPFTNAGEIVDAVVHHPMSEGAKLAPVSRIERLFGLRGTCGLAQVEL